MINLKRTRTIIAQSLNIDFFFPVGKIKKVTELLLDFYKKKKLQSSRSFIFKAAGPWSPLKTFFHCTLEPIFSSAKLGGLWCLSQPFLLLLPHDFSTIPWNRSWPLLPPNLPRPRVGRVFSVQSSLPTLLGGHLLLGVPEWLLLWSTRQSQQGSVCYILMYIPISSSEFKDSLGPVEYPIPFYTLRSSTGSSLQILTDDYHQMTADFSLLSRRVRNWQRGTDFSALALVDIKSHPLGLLFWQNKIKCFLISNQVFANICFNRRTGWTSYWKFPYSITLSQNSQNYFRRYSREWYPDRTFLPLVC